MHKTPPQEEPREEGKIHHSESYSLPQRRRKAPDSGLPPRIFHTDEHPEIPKIKRASRYSNAQNDLPTASAQRKRRTNNKTDKPSAEDQTARGNKQEDIPAVPDTTSTLPVAQRRASAPYAPPSTSYAPLASKRRHHRQRLQRAQTDHQQHQRKKQLFPLVTSSPRRKLIATGGLMLTVALLILVVTTTSHQLSAKDTQEPINSLGNNAIVFHNAGTDISRQIAIPQQQDGHPAPPVLATSAYLLDADTGATLYASNPSMHLPMFSTTKLMTALVATQIGDPNQNILINDTIANDINQLSADSSLMGIKQGETYTLKDLLYGMLLVSGNDAAVAIADQLGGGNQQNFVNKMNQEAVKLGLRDTHYMNPHGLPTAGQFSSARDLALLAKYSLNVPLIHTISSTREYDIPKTATHEEHQMLNANQFLWWYPGVDGGKPGWDDATDFIQVISCIRNHHHLIGAVMHTVDWWTDMRDLMNWGFNTYNWISPHDISASDPIPYAADWHYFDKDTKETTIPTADQGRYYIYTGYSISNPIMAYFDANGGLNTFGYPTSQAKKLSDSVSSQQFEHGTIHCDQKTKQCTKA